MQEIRFFKLKNDGAFVVRIEVIWTHVDEDGNEGHGTYRPKGYHDICQYAERTLDLNDTNIPNGATVNIKAEVVYGKDNPGEEKFIYKETAAATAKYRIKGTTLSNQMWLQSCN